METGLRDGLQRTRDTPGDTRGCPFRGRHRAPGPVARVVLDQAVESQAACMSLPALPECVTKCITSFATSLGWPEQRIQCL